MIGESEMGRRVEKTDPEWLDGTDESLTVGRRSQWCDHVIGTESSEVGIS